MKTLKGLKGVKELSKSDQRTINGGIDRCKLIQCIPEDICINGVCIPRSLPWDN